MIEHETSAAYPGFRGLNDIRALNFPPFAEHVRGFFPPPLPPPFASSYSPTGSAEAIKTSLGWMSEAAKNIQNSMREEVRLIWETAHLGLICIILSRSVYWLENLVAVIILTHIQLILFPGKERNAEKSFFQSYNPLRLCMYKSIDTDQLKYKYYHKTTLIIYQSNSIRRPMIWYMILVVILF